MIATDFIINSIAIGFTSLFAIIALISIPPSIISDCKNNEAFSHSKQLN